MRLNIKYFSALCLMLLTTASIAFAQSPTNKLVLKQGQKISMTNEMKSDIDQAARGKMNMKMASGSELEVLEITDKGYKIGATMQTAKMNFKGFGQEQEYDSEDKEKQKGMIATMFNKVLGKQEIVEIDFDGKMIKKDAPKKKGGMMSMMGGGDVASTVAGAFLIVPAGTKVGEKWRTTDEKEGLKIITEYTYQGMMGNMVNVTANQQTKGEVSFPRGTTNVNQLTQMTIMADATTGLISMKTIETRDNSTTVMGDQTSKSSGLITMTITCE